LSEWAQRFAEHDALEQRTTALYVAAADQLGSDKAAVRLAGLYALERLGQDNPKLRQTVFDVWCAYLRMPYQPPVEVLRENATLSPHALTVNGEVPEADEQPQRREELQVRLTAQRLLTSHLRFERDDEQLDVPEPATYWRGPAGERMNLDLAGAVLAGLSLTFCCIGSIDLSGAIVHGDAYLGADFHGTAYLIETEFHGSVSVPSAHFYNEVALSGAKFYGSAFVMATFHDAANFGKTQFYGSASFGGSEFCSYVDFTRVKFHGDSDLEGMFVSSTDAVPPGWTTHRCGNGRYEVKSAAEASEGAPVPGEHERTRSAAPS